MFLFSPVMPVPPAARGENLESDQAKRPYKYTPMGIIGMFVKFRCESCGSTGILASLRDRSERTSRFPPLLTAGSLSASFCGRQQQSVMFIFQRSQERTEALTRRRHPIIWRSHLSIVFTPERVNSAKFKGNKNDLSGGKIKR